VPDFFHQEPLRLGRVGGLCHLRFVMNVFRISLKSSAAIFLSAAILCLSAVSSADDKTSFVKPTVVPSLAFNPLSEAKIKLGQRLFFERRLSGGNSMSCASCHQPDYSWTDPRRFSLGETGVPRPRRTPSLQDVAWNILFARDGRVETLEGFVLGPITHAEEMNQDIDLLTSELEAETGYPDLFEAAFGARRITLDGITQSLATYVRTLRSAISPFDRWIKGDTTAMSEAAQSGFNVFSGDAGCSQCHTGWRFTDQQFHDIGLKTDDKGRGKLKPDAILSQYAFKTPSLRNVAIRPPYMHNGSISSLEEVMDHYQAGFISRPSLSPLIRRFKLTDQEKLNIIEFLKSLTDDIR